MQAEPFRNRARAYWRKEIRPLLILGLVLFAIRSSLADWNDVPTGSMRPTILEGDRVYVNKLAYDLKVPFTTWHVVEWANPRRGDIVVFYSPHDGKRLVKRVIGLPGDVLELRNDRLILNGQAVAYEAIPQEMMAQGEGTGVQLAVEELPGVPHQVAAIPGAPAPRNFGPYRVPDGRYFMMGDNRDNSFDSRFWGPVERKRILGRAAGIALSFDRQHYWVPRWDRFFRSFQSRM